MDLFSSFPLLDLRNRTVMAPLTRFHSDVDGCPSPEQCDYYVRRAESEAGLIIVESCAINCTDAMGYLNGMQFHSIEHAEAWKPVINKVHHAGAKIWVQLFHAGRLTVPEITNSYVYSASPLKTEDYPSFWRHKSEGKIFNFQTNTQYQVPHEIPKHELRRVIDEFVSAVKLAEQAGFDGVEIHGAHGYLIHTFLSKKTNVRDDEYGENLKMVSELIKGCREVVKRNFTISFRLSVHMVDNPMIRYSEESQDFNAITHRLEACGVDVFHCSQVDAKKPLFGHNKTLHEVIRENTDRPIIICGGIQTLEQANALIEQDENALVAFGRNFISNPALVEHLKNKPDEIEKFDYAKHINTIY